MTDDRTQRRSGDQWERYLFGLPSDVTQVDIVMVALNDLEVRLRTVSRALVSLEPELERLGSRGTRLGPSQERKLMEIAEALGEFRFDIHSLESAIAGLWPDPVGEDEVHPGEVERSLARLDRLSNINPPPPPPPSL